MNDRGVLENIARVPQPGADGRAVVLLSGGLDSSTVLAWVVRAGWEPVALSFDYGQSHPRELQAARAQARRWDAEHLVAKVDLRPVGASALLGAAEVPRDRNLDEPGIPVTYVPARNALFLTYALALAEGRGIRRIFLGVNAVDFSGYPDCRPEFLVAFQRMADLATKMGVEGRPIQIHAPLLFLGKRDIVLKASELGVDLAETWTCYAPTPEGPCGRCDACRLRAKGFSEAGLSDPLVGSL